MFSKTCGRMMNISEGPEFWATASPEPRAAKVAGTIMRPARSEMPNVVEAIWVTLEVSLVDFSK